MEAEEPGQWVRIASFLGPFAEIEADLLLTNLRGSDIPAMRLPVLPVWTLVLPATAGILPIRVFVPPHQVPQARELLTEQPRPSVPEPVRIPMRWLLGFSFLSWLAGASLTFSPRAWGNLAEALQAGCWIATFWTGLDFVVWLRRERPRVVDWRPAAAIVLVFLAVMTFCALAGCLATWRMEVPVLVAGVGLLGLWAHRQWKRRARRIYGRTEGGQD